MAVNRINNTGKVQNAAPDQTAINSSIGNSLSSLSNFIITARVTDIILNENHPNFKTVGEYNGIGAIYYEKVNESGTTTSETNFALPYNPQLKTYPLINEYVLLINIPNNQTGGLTSATSYFYLDPVNIWNHPHHDAYPNPVPNNNGKILPTQTDDYTSLGAVSGSVRRVGDDNEYFPDSELNSKNNLSQFTFEEKADIHPLMPFMGDVLLEGRHGQSIRFGSTAKPPSTSKPILINNNWSITGSNGDPITIIRNGQNPNFGNEGWVPVTEDVSKDLSSIYLTSYQKIPFSIANENFVSYTTSPITPSQFKKPQIILNSDRIILNSKSDSILISGEQSISLSSNGSINIESKQIYLDGVDIRLGNKNASQAVLKGNDTVTYLKILINELKNITEALKTIQNWPEGTPIPNSTMLTVANSSQKIFEDVYDNIDSIKSNFIKTI